MIKSSSNYPALQQSISGIYSISNKLFVGSLIFAGVVVSLLLFLWMNARKKEIAVLLSLGISKLEIFGQFLIEMVFISIPAFVGSYFLAQYTADKLGNNILNKVTGDIAKGNFQNGKVGFYLSGPWDVNAFKSANVNFGVAPFPQINGAPTPTVCGVKLALVPSSSKKKKWIVF